MPSPCLLTSVDLVDDRLMLLLVSAKVGETPLDLRGCTVTMRCMDSSLLRDFSSVHRVDVSRWIQETTEQVLVFSGPASRQEAIDLCRFLTGRGLHSEVLPPPVPDGRWEVVALSACPPSAG
jgi:hypothetical protein